MRACEAIFGPDQGDAIEELVIAATGGPCPCRAFEPCPLLDERGRNPLAEQVPRQREVPSPSEALALLVEAAHQA